MVKKVFLLLVISAIMAGFLYADSLTLTTYYPAPFGAYDRFRLVPREELTGSCDNGTLYVNNSDGDVKYCQNDGTWGFVPGAWKQTGNNVILSDALSNPDLKVGIGTPSPSHHLDIYASTGNASLRVKKDAGSDFQVVSQTNSTVVGTSSDTNLELQTNNATQVYVSNTGNVGIGTSTPSGKLDVNGGAVNVKNTSGDSQITLQTAGGWYTIGIDSSDNNNLKINFGNSVGGTNQLVLTPSGELYVYGKIYVQIGTDPVGEIKLRYIDDGSNSGYYAMYAP
jgi:hypothetical protein